MNPNKANVFLKNGKPFLGADICDGNCGMNAAGTTFSFYAPESKMQVLCAVPLSEITLIEIYENRNGD